MGGRGSGGWNRLTEEQHRARGTYRRDRHAVRVPSVPPDNFDYIEWCDGLSPAARMWGKWFFDKGQVPNDRLALRQYLEKFAIYMALRYPPADVKAALHQELIDLNAKVRWTWR